MTRRGLEELYMTGGAGQMGGEGNGEALKMTGCKGELCRTWRRTRKIVRDKVANSGWIWCRIGEGVLDSVSDMALDREMVLDRVSDMASDREGVLDKVSDMASDREMVLDRISDEPQ